MLTDACLLPQVPNILLIFLVVRIHDRCNPCLICNRQAALWHALSVCAFIVLSCIKSAALSQGLVYSTIAPVTMPFTLFYFAVGRIVWRYQVMSMK